MSENINENDKKSSGVELLTTVMPFFVTIGTYIMALFLNNTFEIKMKTEEVIRLGKFYTKYEIMTEPLLENAKLGLQGYIEIIYEDELIGRILVDDLYDNRAYVLEGEVVSIICRSTELQQYCADIKKALIERYNLKEDKLQIKQDSILGFRYTILRQNFEISRYFRLNENNPLHITKKVALEIINPSEDTNILVEGNLIDLLGEKFEMTIQQFGNLIAD